MEDLRADGYVPISDYGFLSDCRSAALVASDGAIDWLCWPRFDSPSVFGRILDKEKGGTFSVSPVDKDYEVERTYLESSNVLQTIFTTKAGKLQVTDWLHKGARQALCRLIMCLEGEVEVEVICDPRPNYGAEGPVTWHERIGYLVCDLPEDGHRLILEGVETPEARVTLQGGEVLDLTLGFNRPGPSDLLSSLRRTVDFWQHWAGSLKLPNHKREDVLRSALTLKGLQYEPTGAIIAAATTSLPEAIGGDRNYDYRFSWLRDTVFTLDALASVGKLDEAQSWFDWIKNVMLATESAHLQIMYGLDGESDLVEQELSHLEGYKCSRPVRIGNAATSQRQMDVYGEMLDAIWLQQCASERPLNQHRWLLVEALAERTCLEWLNPDEGIWEIRSRPQHFIYSKAMCWVTLDRAIKLAEEDKRFRETAPLEKWRTERDAIKAQVLRHGYDEELGAFTRSYDSGTLGAECLLLARVGFIEPDDERFVSTVRAIQRDLTRGGLVDRYHQEDGFESEEGTFTVCSLWLVLALLEIEAREDAEALFEKVLSHANDLGLLSEELAPSGEQLGNYPQAFTHIAIIACAVALDSHAEDYAVEVGAHDIA